MTTCVDHSAQFKDCIIMKQLQLDVYMAMIYNDEALVFITI